MTARRLALLAVLASVVLAGCSGLGGGDSTPSPDDSGTPTPNVTATATSGEATVDVSASELADRLRTAANETDEYRFRIEQNQTVTSNNAEQTASIQRRGAIDRADRTYRLNTTRTRGGQSTDIRRYLVNETAYAASDTYVQQYSSRWIKSNVSGSLDAVFDGNDALARVPELLANASLSVTGREPIDGTEAYVLRVDRNETDIARQIGSTETVTVHEAVLWIHVDAESGRPLRVQGRRNLTSTSQGQSVESATAYDRRLRYDDVSIQLPEEAETAVIPNEAEGSTGTETNETDAARPMQ